MKTLFSTIFLKRVRGSLLWVALCPWASTTAAAHNSATPTATVAATADSSESVAAAATPVLVDVASLDHRILFDLKYATTDNFTGRILYPVARCFLRPAVAVQLSKAQDYLDVHYAGLRLIMKDCYRPVTIQRALYDVVRGTEQAAYVANPDGVTGSVHTYGAAVDLSLVDATGKEIDMGTPYDHLGRLAQPRYEAEYLASGQLTQAQVRMRRTLREAMCKANFLMIPNEWWHFDALQGKTLRAHYMPLDMPLERL